MLVRGKDPRSLPLTPIEGFVLSRLDGIATVADVADLTGQSLGAVLETLERLAGLDLVEWTDDASGLPRRASRHATRSIDGSASPSPAARGTGLGATEVFEAPSIPAPSDANGAFATRAREASATSSERPSPKRPSGVHFESVRLGLAMGIETVEARPSRPPRTIPTLRSASGTLLAPTEFATARAPQSPIVDGGQSAHASGEPPHAQAASEPSQSRGGAGDPLDVPPAMPEPRSREPERPREPTADPKDEGSATGGGAATGARASSEAAPPRDEGASEAPEHALSAERRSRIDELYRLADLLDHYQVLGLARSADRAKVKSAYFELSKQFHPDTAFRKDVGAYRQKMEVVFKRLTEAYDVLSKKKLRAEYDAYLARSEASEVLEQVLAASPPPSPTDAPPASSRASANGSASAPRDAGSSGAWGEAPSARGASAASSPRDEPAAARAPDPARISASASPRRALYESEDAKQRAQELLKRRLGSARTTMRGPMSAPPAEPAAPKSREQLARELAASVKMAERITGPLDVGARHVSEARRRRAMGELSEALKAYRLAVALAPTDERLRAEHDATAFELAVSLADTYAQQAEYEEQHHKWAAAALSWQKVVAGRPDDARSHWRCANALLSSSGDAKQALRLAQRAVELDPTGIIALRTLGRAYLAAGMTLNARRELARALELAPHDPAIRDLLQAIEAS